jgi:hypothetical protein
MNEIRNVAEIRGTSKQEVRFAAARTRSRSHPLVVGQFARECRSAYFHVIGHSARTPFEG